MNKKIEKKLVLLADDNKSIMSSFKIIFDDFYPCFERVTVSDGAEAIREIREKNFFLIITDFEMPKANGIDVFLEAKKVYGPSAKIIIVSGNRHAFSEIRKRIAGQEEVVSEIKSCLLKKPFSIHDFNLKMEAVGGLKIN